MNIDVTSRKFNFIENLHLFVLSGFAIAQPIYDILGQYPEFFIAHRAGPLMILGVVLFLSFALPLGLCVIKLAVRPFGDSAHRALHLILVCILAVLAFMPVAGRFILRGDILCLAVTLIAGLIFTVLYVRLQPVRTLVTVLLPAVVIFPLWFLGMTPVARLILPQSVEGLDEVKIENPAPVVVIVLDELNPTALLDQSGRIDPVRFPNFAKLAEKSFWFPNAVGPHYQTMYALPAILTGRQPRPELGLNPTASDHPKNLFTLLGGRYQVNALEAQTELCPEFICQAGTHHIRFRDPHTFWTDLGIIYLHIIAPPKWAQSLPSLEGQWTGFVAGGQADKEYGSITLSNGRDYRVDQFEHFVSAIDENIVEQLHFLHILFPHVPYEYLSTGHTYNRSVNHIFPEGIRVESEGWSQSEALLHVAYHQYLQQIGFTDLLLGKLFQKLKENNIYEKSLIILTADHGVSFQPGKHRRKVTSATAVDILKVPMIVKLPEQQQAKINEQLVSGVDILPTIADILEIRIPWDLDGRSMFSENEPSSKTWIEIAAGPGQFNLEKLEGFPGLQWHLRHGGTPGTPLQQLGSQGPFPDLIGRKISQLFVEQAERLFFKSEIVSHFDQVNLASGFLPALFSGHISGTNELDLPLAIGLNGRIRATTTISQWLQDDSYFAVLLPAEAFKTGRNIVKVFQIIERTEGLSLLQIPGDHQEMDVFTIRCKTNGIEVLVWKDGVEIPIDLNKHLIHGYIDHLIEHGNTIYVQGWAGDKHYQPVDSVLVFAGEQLVGETRPRSSRADVAEHFKQNSMLYSGFHIEIPVDPVQTDISDIRVIVVSKSENARELTFSGDRQ